VLVTLAWQGDAFLGLNVGGGSSQKVVTSADDGDNVVKVLVPWARRDLTVTVDPQEVLDRTDYTLTVQCTTVIADGGHDRVPDVADNCPTAKGTRAGAGRRRRRQRRRLDVDDSCPEVAGIGADGCPTANGETVVAFLDGKRVDVESIYTRHGAYGFRLDARLPRGRHQLTVSWYDGDQLVKSTRRQVR
jgi:hypothetical protein